MKSTWWHLRKSMHAMMPASDLCPSPVLLGKRLCYNYCLCVTCSLASFWTFWHKTCSWVQYAGFMVALKAEAAIRKSLYIASFCWRYAVLCVILQWGFSRITPLTVWWTGCWRRFVSTLGACTGWVIVWHCWTCCTPLHISVHCTAVVSPFMWRSLLT